MNTAKFPTELEATQLIDTDGYVLVSDGDGQAKKMRPSVTHTRATNGDGSVGQTTNLLTEEGAEIVNAYKSEKNDTTTHDQVYIRTADGNDVVYAQRNLTDDGNTTHDEVTLQTADTNTVFSAFRDLDAESGNVTHDEVYLNTADGNNVVKCQRSFDSNGNETDKVTKLYAKSLKSLKVDTSSDGTFTAEQLACGSGRASGTVHQITSATQTIDIQGDTISVFEVDASMSATSITIILQNVPKSNDPNVLLGGRVVVINKSQVNATVAFSATGLTGGIGINVDSGETKSQQIFTMNGKFFECKQDASDMVQDMSAVAAGDKATKYPSVAAVEAALDSFDVSVASSPAAITGEVDICRYPITDTTTTIALTITPTTVASGKAKSVEIILDNTANTLNCMATVTLTDTTNWTLYNDAQTLEVLAGERLVLNVQMINDGVAQIVMLN